MSNSSSMFKSSLGKKLVMGITGLFLISFLMKIAVVLFDIRFSIMSGGQVLSYY